MELGDKEITFIISIVMIEIVVLLIFEFVSCLGREVLVFG